MELIFEHAQKVGDGHDPVVYHSPDNVLQVFYTDGEGRIWAATADTPRGDFADRVFGGETLAAPDTGTQHLALAYLPRINIWTMWLATDTHRMAVFTLKQETNKYLVDGNLSFKDDDPTVTLALTLENPAGVIAAEDVTATPPGTRINVFFQAGTSTKVPLGVYYLDRIVTAAGDPRVTISARNITGKLLKDQTFDEEHQFGPGTMTEILTEILDQAGVKSYRVDESNTTLGLECPPNMSYFEGIKAVMSLKSDWKIREDATGRILIGDPGFLQAHMPVDTYYFHRDRDCFGREIIRDDRETYSRVCVHDRDFEEAHYKDVEFVEGWNLPRNKTLYVEGPEGSPPIVYHAMAYFLAERMAAVGIVESFNAPFRPQLIPGDQAEIEAPGHLPKIIGTVTEVGLQFGRGGFYTDFTVDSGGVIRKPSIRDLVELISGKRDVGSAKITDTD